MRAPARRSVPLALLLLGGGTGCGDDTAGPDLRVYQIAAVQTNTETLADGTQRHFYQVTVNEGNLFVSGAWMLFTVSHGDVTPQSDRTDLSGRGRVEWTLEPGDYAGLGTATLSGCAQNLAPPDCTPTPIATISFD